MVRLHVVGIHPGRALCVISFTCGSLSESHSGCSRVLALDGYLQHGGVPFCKVRAVNSSQFSVLTLDYFYFYFIFSSFSSVHNFYFSVSLPSYFKSIFDLNFNHLSCLFSFLYFHINPFTLLSSLANFSVSSRLVSQYFLKIRTLEVLAQILETGNQ